MALPKVNLHCHLPGALPPHTFVAHAREQGAHPIFALIRSGIAAAIGDDDPATFGEDLVAQLEALLTAGLTWAELHVAQVTGLQAAFCAPPRRRELVATLNAGWASVLA